MVVGTVAETTATHANESAENYFVHGGYARTTFHESRSWNECYGRLQSVSRQFVSRAWRKGPEGYRWPLDPLNCWSRAWEYPFVADQLRRNGCEGHGLRLLDVGAAVTFFPYYLIPQGFQLTNLDSDPSMRARFQQVFRRLSNQLGINGVAPEYLIADARDTRLPAASFDIVTCISVLEHIPQWERAISELSRLLVPGGLLILTFDVQYSGPADALSEADCQRLFRLIGESMDIVTRDERSIPTDVLTPFTRTWQTPRPFRRPLWQRLWPVTAWPRKIINRMRRGTLAVESQVGHENICIFGGVWRKR